MPPELVSRIASCERGFERTVPTPVDWGAEHEVLVLPIEDDGEPLFPECVRCELSNVGNQILLMPDNDGTLYCVKVCCTPFRAVGEASEKVI